MKLYIKNMVCDRCILVICNTLSDIHLTPQHISLGLLDFGEKSLTTKDIQAIKTKIEPLGFTIIEHKNSKVIEMIKTSIIKMVEEQDETLNMKLSQSLTQRLNYEYSYLSQLFSSVESITIEQYFIKQKIEKAKELLIYNELTLTEIAYRLSYSSVAHLSTQFKKITGLTPSHFKQSRDSKQRVSLDKI